MKSTILFVSLLISSIGFSQEKEHFVTEFTQETKATWIDIRTPEEFSEGTIGNAVNIDFYSDDFKKEMNTYDKSQEIIIFCKGGGRSAEAFELLKEEGFTNIKEFEGGYEAYISKEEK